jgi:predicted transcriptional regulator of viral defense system
VPIENFDTRFIPSICKKLDLINRENWRNTVKEQVNIRQVAQKLKMPGSVDRTENDNYRIQQRKQEIEQISHE